MTMNLVFFYSQGEPYDKCENLTECKDMILDIAKNEFDNIYYYTPEMLRITKNKYFVKEYDNTGVVSCNTGAQFMGFFSWKPFIILEVLNKMNDNDILVYRNCNIKKYPILSDYSNFRHKIESFLNYIKFDFCISRDGDNKLIQFCKTNVIRELGENHLFTYFFPLLCANFIVLKKSKISIEFLNEWIEACKNESWLNGEVYGDLNPYFKWHTCDQAIMCVIIANWIRKRKHNIPLNFSNILLIDRDINNIKYVTDYAHLKYIGNYYTGMINMISNIPDIKNWPLEYIFEKMKIKHKENTLWLEFGVYSGKTINYISKFTNKVIYGFDSFLGLPETWRDGYEKGTYNTNGIFPSVNSNVGLIKGWFNETLHKFINSINKKVSFIHIDCNLYSSTKYVLNTLKNHLDNQCIIVFDKFVNYPGYDTNGELKAFYEFIIENNIKYEWIGMKGIPFAMTNYENQSVAVIIYSNIEKYISNKVLIVVARYNEDIAWTKQFSNVLIYNKGNKLEEYYKKVEILDNVGREGHTYYKYIYDNYDNLEDYIIFLQGNPFDHTPNIINDLNTLIYDKIDSNLTYKTLCNLILNCNLNGCPVHPNLPLREVYFKLFNEHKNDMSFDFGAGAQFIVSKTQILKRPKSFYLKIVEMLENDTNPIEGFVIERFHNLIFS